MLNAKGFRPASELYLNRLHGDRLRYISGCRCDQCRKANAIYNRIRRASLKDGSWEGYVPVDKALKHLLMLRDYGLGYTSIEKSSGVDLNTLFGILNNKKKKIKKDTENSILAVTPEDMCDLAKTSANETWRLINKLVSHGYTKRKIANMLGVKQLQIGEKNVSILTARKVKAMYMKCLNDGFSLTQHERSLTLAVTMPTHG